MFKPSNPQLSKPTNKYLSFVLLALLISISLVPLQSQATVVFNEVLADPGSSNGDANGDGTISTSQDEFVELYNTSSSPIDISGWEIHDNASTSLRHVFANNTTIPGNAGYLVFGGGTIQTANNYEAYSGTVAVTASTGTLGINNSNEILRLKDADGNEMQTLSFGSASDQSKTRDVVGTGSFVKHTDMDSGARYSPGSQDGTRFVGAPVANAAPVVTNAPDTAPIIIGNSFAYTPSATDSDNDTLTFALTIDGDSGVGSHDWLSFNTTTGELSGVSDEIEEINNIIITVNDGNGASTDIGPFSINVIAATNSAPSIASIPAITVFAKQTLVTDLNAYISDLQSPNSALTLQANDLSWASTTGTELTLAPVLSDIGTHTLTLSVSDGELSTTDTIEINVVPLVLLTEYVEGGSFNKAIEITNLSDVTVDATKLTVKTLTNSNSDLSAAPSETLTGTLATNQSVVIYNNQASDEVKALGNISNGSVANITGNDSIVLIYDDIIIDSFGKLGENVSWNTNGVDAKDNTLRRKAITGGDINPNDTVDFSLEWETFSKDTFDGLGCPGISACMSFTTTSLPSVSQGQVYSQTVTSSGAENITYSLSGNENSGLSIDTTSGEISGVVLTNSDIVLDITAADADDSSRSVTTQLTINVTPTTLVFTTQQTLLAGVPNQAYSSVNLALSFDSSAFTFAVTGGSLPAGINLDTNSGEVSGTPTTAGNYSFTITATANDQPTLSVQQPFDLTVAASSVTITGDATQGQTLTADTITIIDSDSNGFSYQWKKDGVDITGETNSTYVTTDDDVNSTLSVTVTYTTSLGQAASLTAATSESIANTNDAPTWTVADQTIIKGIAFNYTPTVNDATNDDTSIYTFAAISDLPAGISYDENTNTFSGTPTETGTSAPITVTVTDGTHSITSSAFSITVESAPAANLLITEYLEGSSYNKAIEITNMGPNTAYTELVKLYRCLGGECAVAEDGSLSEGTSISLDAAISAQIAVNDVYVIANNRYGLDAINIDQQSSLISHNGDDSYVLLYDNVIVDSFGDVDTDPGSAWSVNLGDPSYSTKDRTLVRSGCVTQGDTVVNNDFDVTSGWIVSDTNTVSNLGSHDSNCTSIDTLGTVAMDLPTDATFQAGTVVSANNGLVDINGIDNNSVSYQWYRGDNAISGATAAQYTLTDTDVGGTIKVTISYNDLSGNAKSVTSAVSDTVTAAPVANQAPVISGTPATSVVVGNNFNFAPTATDANPSDGKIFSINTDLSQYPWLNFDTTTGALSGTPTSTDVGDITNIIITVADDATPPLSDSLAPFTLSIEAQTVAPVSGVLITEYHETGSSKVIEISNLTDGDIDLNQQGYSLALYSNSNESISQQDNLIGTLVAGSSLVVYKLGSDSDFTLPSPRGFAISNGAMNFNGNDAVVLMQNTTIIDSIGVVGNSDTFAEDTTLRRKADSSADTDLSDAFDATQWQSFSKTTFEGLGCSGVAACTGNEPQPTSGQGSDNVNTCIFSSCDQPAKVADKTSYTSAGYYVNALAADSQDESALRTAIHSDIKDHTQLTYNEVWMVLIESDQDPDNNDNIRLIYKSDSILKTANNSVSNSSDSWNREHVWSKSRGFPSDSQLGYTDVHHLVPSDKSVNSARNNIGFGEGGERYDDDGDLTDSLKNGSTSWQPRAETKGDIARMMMYMDIRYDGSDSDMPDLVLKDQDYPAATGDSILPELGKLCTLYKWHSEDPVDSFETNRNNVIYEYQGNRNPFIDHPEWVASIYGSQCNVSVNTAPTASDSSVSVAEDASVNITPVVADAESETNALTYSIITPASNGVLNSQTVPWSYTPNANFNGTDTLVFTVSDGEATSTQATINITVTAIDDAPVISGTPATTVALNGEYNFTPTVSDIDSSSFTYSMAGQPSWLTIDASSGNLSGTANVLENATGIVITVTDGTNSASLPAFAIVVEQGNVAPVANGNSLTTDEDTVATFTPSGSDSNGDSITYSAVTTTSNGTLNTTGGSWLYTPAENFTGSDSFSYKANDGDLDSAIATVSIVVNAVNDAPQGVTQTRSTDEDQDLVIDLTTVFNDVDGDPLSYTLDSQSDNGSVTLSGDSLTYQPNADFSGANSIAITATDGTLSSDSTTLNVNVTAVADAPVISGIADTSVFVGSTYSFTPLAEDVDNDELSFSISDISNAPWLSFDTTTGVLTGSPVAGQEGTVEDIVITVTDDSSDALTDTLTAFTITVLPQPVASVIFTEYVEGSGNNKALEITNISNQIVDLSTVKITNFFNGNSTVADQYTVTLAGQLAAGESYVIVKNNADAALQEHADLTAGDAVGFNGDDTLVLYVNDVVVDSIGIVGTDPGSKWQDGDINTQNSTLRRLASVSLGDLYTNDALDLVTEWQSFAQDTFDGLGCSGTDACPVNVTPSTADSTVSVAEDSSVNITPTASDSDSEDALLTYTVESSVINGTLNTDQLPWTYTPDTDFNGTDSLTFTVSDGELVSPVATVTITVAAVNDAPVISGTPATTAALNGTYAFNPVATDIDNDSLVYTMTGQPSWLSIDASNGNVSGTVDSLEDASAIIISVSDGETSVSLAPFALTVQQGNIAPVANDNALNIAEDTITSFTPSGSDSNGDSIQFSLVSTTTNGVLDTTSTDWRYTPAIDFVGIDSFTYKATDGTLDSTVATVSITVTAINDAPQGQAQALTTEEDQVVTLDLTTVFSDVDSETLSYSIETQGAAGIAIIEGQTLSYLGDTDVNGTDELVISATDGELTSDNVIIDITVTAVNDAPIAEPQTVTVAEDNTFTVDLTTVFSDVDGDNLTFTLETQAEEGIATVTGDILSYVTTADYNGDDALSVTATDSDGEAETVIVDIIVTAVNDAPVISGEPSLTANDQATYSFTPVVSDDNETLTYSVTGLPAWATFDAATGTISGQPTAEDEGVYNDITISVSDGTITENLDVFSITVDAINTAPVVNSFAVTTLEDQNVAIAVVGEDSENDELSSIINSQPSNGDLIASGNGQYIYQPNANFNGTDSFTYSMFDGELNSDVATVSITVDAVNDSPVVTNDIVSFESNDQASYVIDVLANDSDLDSNSLTVALATSSAGTVSVTDGNLILDLSDSAVTSILIQYSVQDSDGATAIGYALVDVTRAAIVGAPALTTPDNVTVDATGLMTHVNLGVATAVDANGTPLAVELLRDSQLFAPGRHIVEWQATDSSGQTTLSTQQVVVNPLVAIEQRRTLSEGSDVTAAISLNGTAADYPVTIEYTVSGTANSDDHDLVSGSVVIESGVSADIHFNVTADDIVETDETVIITLTDDLNVLNDNRFVLTIKDEPIAPVVNYTISQADSLRTLIDPTAGNVKIEAGIIGQTSSDDFAVTWFSENALVTNISSQQGVFEFNPTDLTDGIYTVELSVSTTGESPLTTTLESYFEVKAEQAVLTGIDSDGDLIPDNQEGLSDSDSDGIPDYLDAISQCNLIQQQATDSQSFLVQTEPGTCIRKGVTIADNETGGVLLSATEIDQVLAVDEEASISGALVDFVMHSLNIGESYPVVIPQTAPIPANALYRKYSSENGWVNFEIDQNNQILSTQGERGQCPAANDTSWTDGLTEGHWCVKLVIQDGGLNDDDGKANGQIVDPGGVAVIKSNNQAPVAIADSASLRVNESTIIDVIINDTDADGDALTVLSATAAIGSVEVVDNQLLYTADANFLGSTGISYTLSDSKGGITIGTVTVVVAQNQAPIALDDATSVLNTESTTIDVLANDSDPENDTLTIIVAVTDHGTVTINDDNQLVYVADANNTSTATIIYTVQDAFGAISFAKVVVTVDSIQTVVINAKTSSGGVFNILLLIGLLGLGMRRRYR